MDLHVWDKPSIVLRALMEARYLMANHDVELKDVLDSLVRSASEHIDQQEEDLNPYIQAAKKAEEDEIRRGAVEAARRVAAILISYGGDAARETLGVPPPNPLEQQRIRATVVLEGEKAASELNSVVIEIDDDADHGVAGRHYRVAANLYLPVHIDLDPLPSKLNHLKG